MTSSKPLTLVAVGQSLIKRDISACTDPAFRAALALIGAADVAFTNFEGAIRGRHGGWPTKPGFFGAADPMVLDVLGDLGFSALSLANNHAFDLGPGGVLSTLEEVARRGFLHAGIGVDLTSAAQPGTRDTRVGRIALVAADAGPAGAHTYAMDATDEIPARPGVNRQSVTPLTIVSPEDFSRLQAIEAALGHRARRAQYRATPPPDRPGRLDFYGMLFEPGPAPARRGELSAPDLARNLAAISQAAASSRLVIAYLHHHHWEAVWEDIPSWTRDYAHACIDAGADIFISHGVPLLQGIEIYRDRPILYSLGNFIFHSAAPGGWTHEDIWRSVIATCRFDPDGAAAELVLHPIVIDRTRDVPMLADPAAGTQILHKLAGLSAPLGTTITIGGGIGHVSL
jgi:poly-gamma-glutamate synthesis protein (capsule biosynthesis protein)